MRVCGGEKECKLGANTQYTAQSNVVYACMKIDMLIVFYVVHHNYDSTVKASV